MKHANSLSTPVLFKNTMFRYYNLTLPLSLKIIVLTGIFSLQVQKGIRDKETFYLC